MVELTGYAFLGGRLLPPGSRVVLVSAAEQNMLEAGTAVAVTAGEPIPPAESGDGNPRQGEPAPPAEEAGKAQPPAPEKLGR